MAPETVPPTEPDPVTVTAAGCVCDLHLPCGVHMRQQRGEDTRQAVSAAPRRYRNTEGLRGHANARKRARN